MTEFNLDRAQRALVQAHEAGDTEAASALARAIRQHQQAGRDDGGGAFEFIDNMVRQAANAITFNKADEISAGMNAATGLGDDYATNLARERERDTEFMRENPGAALGAQLAGGLMTGGVGAARVLGSQAIRHAPAAARWAAFPAVGAAEGAAAGFGAAEGGLGNRLSGAAEGAAIGGAVGAALPVVGNVVRRGVVEPIRTATDRGRVSVARDYFRKALDRDKMTPADMGQRMRDLGPDATPADVGPNVSGLGEYGASRPGRALTEATDMVAERRGGSFDRMADDLDRAVGPGGQDVALRVEDSPQFATVLDQRVPVHRDMLTLLRRPSMRDAWSRVQRTAAEQDIALPPIDQVIDDLESGRITGIETRLLHFVKKGLDDTLEAGRDPVTGSILPEFGKNRVHAMEGTRRAYRDMVKRLNPDYGAALDRMASEARIDDALDMGRKAWTSARWSPDAITNRLGKMTDRERRAFRAGMAAAIEDKMAGAAEQGRALDRFVLSNAPKIRAAFGPAADDLIAAAQRERTFAGTEGRLTGNSRTAIRGAIKEDVEDRMPDPTGAIGDAARGSGSGLAMRALEGLWNVVSKPPAAAADEAARMVYQRDMAVIEDFLNRGRGAARPPAEAIPAVTGTAAVTGGSYAGRGTEVTPIVALPPEDEPPPPEVSLLPQPMDRGAALAQTLLGPGRSPPSGQPEAERLARLLLQRHDGTAHGAPPR